MDTDPVKLGNISITIRIPHIALLEPHSPPCSLLSLTPDFFYFDTYIALYSLIHSLNHLLSERIFIEPLHAKYWRHSNVQKSDVIEIHNLVGEADTNQTSLQINVKFKMW